MFLDLDFFLFVCLFLWRGDGKPLLQKQLWLSAHPQSETQGSHRLRGMNWSKPMSKGFNLAANHA